jgi:cytochrome c oxidase subunit 1
MAKTHAHDHGHDHAHDDHHHGPEKGVMRWIKTTNHKDLGTLYLWFSFIMFFIGGLMSLVIRAELYAPGMQFIDPEFYNQMITLHALVMIFGGVMPAFVGLANWMVPMMIGCSDLALPRVNNWASGSCRSRSRCCCRRCSCRVVALLAAGRCIRRWSCRAEPRSR